VGDRTLWVVAFAWEDESMVEPGQPLSLGHIEAYVLEPRTGKELGYKSCG